jgi:hypothetical protein
MTKVKDLTLDELEYSIEQKVLEVLGDPDSEKLDKPIARRILRKVTWLSRNFQSIVPEPLAAGLKGTLGDI